MDELAVANCGCRVRTFNITDHDCLALAVLDEISRVLKLATDAKAGKYVNSRPCTIGVGPRLTFTSEAE